MVFNKLEYNDINKVKDTLYKYAPSWANDFTITGLFMWRDYLNVYVAYEEEGIYIYQLVDGIYLFYPPLCEDRSAGYKKIIDYSMQNDLRYGFYPLDRADLDILDKNGISYEVEESDNYNDYLHYVKDLARFRGKKFHTLKNHVRQFEKRYPGFKFARISDSNIDQIKAFMQSFAEQKQDEELDATETEELIKITEILDDLGAYNMIGHCIFVDGEVVGFELGEIVGEMYYSHIQKANREYAGAYPELVNMVANELIGKAKYINREEDLGNEGLRFSKLKYRPFDFVKKCMVFVK